MNTADHLARAVQLARDAVEEGGRPFGAVVVVDGRIVGEGANRAALENDPTWHAELAAIRAAATALGSPHLEGATVYSSGEPCAMCLAACYWAGIDRVVHGATVEDATAAGFPVGDIYRELALPGERRRVATVHVADEAAVALLRSWAERRSP